MKLSVVFPVHNQHALASAVLDLAIANLAGNNDVEFVVIDNGSAQPFLYVPTNASTGFTFKLVRLTTNIGVYPIFWEALKHATGGIIAVLHSDVFIAEKGWDTRVLQAFESNERLGLVGFVGSNEIDAAGGRGLGTCSNFIGLEYHDKGASWKGSPAEVHGRRETAISKSAVVDGCVMIFRRSVLDAIPQRADFPPHHFYDRLLSCEVLERGYEVAVLGVGFDHIGGQTVNQEDSYSTMASAWAEKNLGIKSPGEYVSAFGNPAHNWDTVIYLEAERRWISEYRDQKHLIPCKV